MGLSVAGLMELETSIKKASTQAARHITLPRHKLNLYVRGGSVYRTRLI